MVVPIPHGAAPPAVLTVPGGSLAAMKADDERIAFMADIQRGVISRRQLFSAGLAAGSLQYHLRPGGEWQRILPGVYLLATGEPTRDQLIAAALLYAGENSLVTGLAALRYQGIRCRDSQIVDVLVAADRQRSSTGYVRLIRSRRMPAAYRNGRGNRYALPARSVADALCGMRPAQLGDARTIVASAVQQRKCTIGHLSAELAARHNKGDAMLRRVLAEVIDGIRSSPEGDLRDLVRRSDLPAPLFNPDLYLNGAFLARPDAWWPQAAVAVEVDSREFHLLPEDWRQTIRRHSRMTAAGILVLHFTPDQLHSESGQVVREIASALAAGRPAAAVTTRPAAA
jgi:hypothetical protein